MAVFTESGISVSQDLYIKMPWRENAFTRLVWLLSYRYTPFWKFFFFFFPDTDTKLATHPTDRLRRLRHVLYAFVGCALLRCARRVQRRKRNGKLRSTLQLVTFSTEHLKFPRRGGKEIIHLTHASKPVPNSFCVGEIKTVNVVFWWTCPLFLACA